MRSGNSTCAGPPGGDQDAPEGSSGARGTAGTRFLQPALPCGESDGGMETCYRPFVTDQLRNHHEVQDGDRRFSPGVSPPKGLDVFHRPPGRISPNPGPSGVLPVSMLCLEGRVYQFKAFCFGLSLAPQVFNKVFTLVSEWAHRRGVRLLRYRDDWMVVAESRDLHLRHQDLVLQLWSTGRSLVPSTHLQYLGMVIDTSLE